MAPTSSPEPLLKQWFPHTTTPVIANAPMLGFTDCLLAGAVTRAGGLGMLKPFEMIYFDRDLGCFGRF
jgi:nitronate monooxygenase